MNADKKTNLLRSSRPSDVTVMGTQRHFRVAVPLLLIWASVSTWGQQPAPEWLAPFPQARDQSATASAMEGASAYTALAHSADVIKHYEQEMRAAGVTFRTQSDGIGTSIVASME